MTTYDVRKILIAHSDRLNAMGVGHCVGRLFPAAEVVVVHDLGGAAASLHAAHYDLLVAGVRFDDGDVFELVAAQPFVARRFQHVLIVTGRREERLLEALRHAPISGVFDSEGERAEELGRALEVVVSGRIYWSPSLQERLQRICLAPASMSRRLTAREQLVLATIGDGSDDDDASVMLGLTPATIASVRRDLHRKLGVRHRGELVRCAAQSGYIGFTPDGVERLGFEALAAKCRPRPGPAPAAAAAAAA